MALTVFETAEQVRPCNAVEQGAGNGMVAVAAAPAPAAAEKAAVKLKETDHGDDDRPRPERADIWNMIQAQKPAPAAPKQQQAAAPYVHPLVRRSSSLLTQKSLEICTESLGSETGSDGFSDADGATDRGSDDDDEQGGVEVQKAAAQEPAPKAFPPPLPSLARRRTVAVGAMEMRQHRRDGRLVVEAVPVQSPTLFRAQRSGGRLLLSFADEKAQEAEDEDQVVEPEQQLADERAHDEEVEEEEEEEEVEVVDRGTVVAFKVSTQPQARGNGNRVHRSALVINKFVGAEPAASATCGEPANNDDAANALQQQHPPPRPPRRPTGSATTAIAALAAASALSASAAAAPGNGAEEEDDEEETIPGATLGENKLLMTARRRRSKEELLKHMRRCGQLSGKKLFFWEEPRIATSS